MTQTVGEMLNKALLSHESSDWYTPSRYIELARGVMGGIDLDPASSFEANKTVKASRIFTIEDDGLARIWSGRVWLNPPYGRTNGKSGEPCQELWSAHLIKQYRIGSVTQAILLTKAALGYNWFKQVRLASDAYCYTDHLIRHFKPGQLESDGKPAKLGSAFFYFGHLPDKFMEIFSEAGEVHRV